MEAAAGFLTPLVYALTAKYGVVVTILVYVGMARLFIKPSLALLEAYTKITPSKTDDMWSANIKASKAYKVIIFTLDWIVSLKLKK